MESPLEVLSRAATMVQDKTAESKLPNKELPTTKWRRERRRLPEYHVTNTVSQINKNNLNESSNGSNSCGIGVSGGFVEAPLDMTVTSAKPRSPPPPYREPLPGSTFAMALTRPTVITQAPKAKDLNGLDDGKDEGFTESISMCDTVIDEHFRRSLGNNYMALFSKNYTKIDIESDSISLSVDDHFAKALGDTWKKLKQNGEGNSEKEDDDDDEDEDENSSDDSSIRRRPNAS